MKIVRETLAMMALLVMMANLHAQAPAVPPQNVAQLSASGSVEAPQDLLLVSLTTTREAADAATVQNQLKTALDAAMTEARKAVLPGQMDMRTGAFSLYPRYGRDGKITTWQGSAELVLEGRDFARISATSGKIQTLTVNQATFSLSRDLRARLEGEAQAVAIERFKAKASEIARGFGFTGYTLREITVTANDQGYVPRPRMMAMEAKASAPDAPLPVEAGRSTVLVTVSGSVQMR
ncbi:MAG: SIMPL domain-containing protein [Burkholderiaceae bacterium]|jgi:predicted secreted protein|nr:SIMPL domain-containing protein [Burkholderiaceae bacterium]